MAELVRRTDNGGEGWVALRAFHPWYNAFGTPYHVRDEPIRDLRADPYSWLVAPEDRISLNTHVSQQTDGLQWMPRGYESSNDPYLGELPWATSVDNEVAHQRITTGTDPDKGIEAYPSWARYLWEANVMELLATTRCCSLEPRSKAV